MIAGQASLICYTYVSMYLCGCVADQNVNEREKKFTMSDIPFRPSLYICINVVYITKIVYQFLVQLLSKKSFTFLSVDLWEYL